MKLKGSISSKSLFAEMNAIPSYLHITIDQELNTESENAIANRAVALFAEEVRKEIADLKYEPIKITSFKAYDSNSKNSVFEIGSTVTAYTLEWVVNQTPKIQTLDGERVDVTTRKMEKTGVNITSNKSWKLAVIDERDIQASSIASITFSNGVYFGVADKDATLDAISTLTKKLKESKDITFTVNAGEGQHIVYFLPTRYGTPAFNVGGFDGGFSLFTTLNFTNSSGYTESYSMWRSDNASLGSTTVKVT